MTALALRARRVAASRGPRVAAALAAAALMASLTGAARQPITLYPVQAAFASPGPYATTLNKYYYTDWYSCLAGCSGAYEITHV